MLEPFAVSAEQPVQEPGRRLLVATVEPFAVDPIAGAALVLDAVVVARAARLRPDLAPPLGRYALRALEAHDATLHPAPDEAGGRTFGHLGNDADGLGRGQEQRRPRGRGRNWPWLAFAACRRAVAQRRHARLRPLRDVACARLQAAHAAGAQMVGEAVDEQRRIGTRRT